MQVIQAFEYGRADWGKFTRLSDEHCREITDSGTLDEWNKRLCDVVMNCALECVPKMKSPKKRVPVPWWNRECNEAVRVRNPDFRLLRKYQLRIGL